MTRNNYHDLLKLKINCVNLNHAMTACWSTKPHKFIHFLRTLTQALFLLVFWPVVIVRFLPILCLT